ncbi:MAG: peptidase S8, partial [Ignavibacteriales bacterium CG18_big_fil_WC_8_21_14_2_50_31_20]
VFNLLGQEVATLVNSAQSVGSHEINFNASNLTSGVYFYTIKAGDFTSTRKMMLIK